MNHKYSKYQRESRGADLQYKVKKLLCVAIVVVCGLLPVYGAAQDRPGSVKQDKDAELNVTPLKSGKLQMPGQDSKNGDDNENNLPIPNKLDERAMVSDERKFDDSWTDGKALKQHSLRQGYGATKKKGDLSQKTKFLLGIKHSLQSKLESEDFVIPPRISSMFFTPRQHAFLREARVGFNLRAPAPEDKKDSSPDSKKDSSPDSKKDSEIDVSNIDLSLDDFGPAPEAKREVKDKQREQKIRSNYIRELELKGIVYNGPDRWIIWLNDKRITPDEKMEQIVDINVKESYAELRWYDGFQEKIFPIRLRSGQRFNFDTRNFANAKF